MPTYAAFYDWKERGASVSATSGRRLREQVEVTTDDPANTTAKMVIEYLGTAEGIFIGLQHPTWPFAILTEFGEATPHEEHPGLWIVPLLFEEPRPVPGTLAGPVGPPPPPVPPPPPGTPPAPNDRPALQTLGYRRVEVYDTADLDGEPINNIVGDLLEDPPPRFRSLSVIGYTRWFATWNVGLGIALHNKVNLHAWNGLAADTVLIDGVEAKPMTQSGYSFWEVNFTLVHDPEKWIPTKLVNSGRRAYLRGGPYDPENLLPVLDTSTVVLLNADGERWVPGDPPAPTRDRRFYNRIDFAGL